MKKNVLREMLNEDKPTIGTHVISPWPGMIEIIGKSGAFDYVEYVGEYSPFSLDQLENIGRTFELFPKMSSMMKVEEQTRGFIASRSIDAGIQNVLFTDIRSAQEAEECIGCVRAETPEDGGFHGVSMRRGPDYYYYGSLPDWVKAMEEVVCAFMIEKKGAMEHLDEILEVEGVDMVQFGPADYSVSIGMTGQMQSPEVQDAQKEMVKKALAKGVHPRVEIGSYEEAKPWLDLGVRHFCIGWDIVTIAEWCKNQAEGMAKLLR